jgi:putative ABC transport system permease protein
MRATFASLASFAASLAWPLIRREWQHHPGRHAVALLAVCLGVALAWSVHLINRSALGEFAAAVRSANGEPDLTLRAQREGFDDTLFTRAAGDSAVSHASPVVELETHARSHAAAPRHAVRVLGIDALRVAPLAADLLPQPAAGEKADDLVFLSPEVAFVNRAARERFVGAGGTLQLQAGAQWRTLRVAGDVAAGGGPLVVIDIAAAQREFGHAGHLTRIDLRLVPGADRAALVARLALPAGVRAVAPEAAGQRVSHLSRAYRVNLTVLALVALLVGAFLVYSVMALSVAQRAPALALLGVLGLTARGRRTLVLAECAGVGVAGGALGLVLGTAMAAAALHLLAGDLGGGYFPGVQPALAFSTPAACVFLALGVGSAVAGGLLPARAAERLQPAQALKGLGDPGGAPPRLWPAWLLLALGVALSFVPPLWGLPLAAYAAVAALLCGGVGLVPAVVHALLRAGLARDGQPAANADPTMGVVDSRLAKAGSLFAKADSPFAKAGPPLARLAWRRAEFHRGTATAATAGVVAALALAVALTVMVASFRTSVARWLDQVLPADLYARSAATAAMAESAWLPADVEQRTAALPGVARVSAARVRSLQLNADRPAVTLMARSLEAAAGAPPPLALVGAALPPHGRLPDVFVSEAVVALYGARAGGTFELPLPRQGADSTTVYVRGVYRDFARQFGSVAMERALYRQLSGDTRISDLALWLAPGADAAEVMAALRALLPDPALLDFATTGELRTISLRIFDRSFAVTYYLQAVAIAIGLVGIAASLSAQVLARRKEFGLLAHLGFTRAQLVALVTREAAVWVAAGALVGVVLGLAVSAVLVHVVNPQSFHWTMEMVLPAARLLALAAAVFVAGTLTSAFAARGAAARRAVLSVKEDW